MPVFGPSWPSRATNALNSSGCLTAVISAQVPPVDHPARPQLAGSALMPKSRHIGHDIFDDVIGRVPLGPLTHSVSLLSAPVVSGKTTTGV